MRHILALPMVALLAAAGLAQPPADNLGTPLADNLGTPAATSVAPATPTIQRSESGKSLVVPSELKGQGTVYYNAPTAAKQVTFLSDGKIKSDGHSSAVIGYAVAGPADNPAALKAGLWAMPVRSLQTGNKLKDTHIADATWLDAAHNPDIIFELKEVRDVKLHKETAGGKSYSATLVGQMTIRGITKPLTIPEAILGFVPASDKSPIKGDLLAIRCKYSVKFSDYGVTNSYTTELKTVSDDVGIDQSLILSTVPPEQQPEVKTDPKPEGQPEHKPEGK